MSQSEEDKRREHLASLTADSDVRAPGIRQRIKEEVQAVYQSIHDKLCLPKKQKTEEWGMRRKTMLFLPRHNFLNKELTSGELALS